MVGEIVGIPSDDDIMRRVEEERVTTSDARKYASHRTLPENARRSSDQVKISTEMIRAPRSSRAMLARQRASPLNKFKAMQPDTKQPEQTSENVSSSD